ncbi:uncharacterized protein [Aristolochia californica]|uniref:uncharacterized protein n=1 Tax=Aristolochia californica TaxID=171875 RepID=UPI0035DCC2BD
MTLAAISRESEFKIHESTVANPSDAKVSAKTITHFLCISFSRCQLELMLTRKYFGGYAIIAAACEGYNGVLGMLVKALASQSACEEALPEASLCGQAEAVELLTYLEMIRPDASVHALISASCRGFVDVVTTYLLVHLSSIVSKYIMLIFCSLKPYYLSEWVDVNSKDRVLLDSVKPILHANVDCTPLVASIIYSHPVWFQWSGAKTGFQVKLGVWSWDMVSGEALKCAHAWKSLRQKHGVQSTMRILLDNGANANFPLKTNEGHECLPIHLTARLGCLPGLQQLILHECEIDARNESGETALMMTARAGKPDCFLELVFAGDDLGLINNSGENAIQLAKSSFWSSLDDVLSKAIIFRKDIFSTKAGNTKSFKLLVMAGADIETVGSILQFHASDSDRDELEKVSRL